MDALENGLDRLVSVTFEWLPLLLGAIVLLILGSIIASALQRLVSAGLQRIQFNRRLGTGQAGELLMKAAPDPTYLLSLATYWLVFLGFVALGASVLGIDVLNELILDIYSYIPKVLAAIAIFLIGSLIAGSVTHLTRNTLGDTPTGKMIQSIVPVIVIGITIFMILDQLGIATTIVTITYAALVGTVALGTALAFGLGGRDVAAKMLEKSYEKGQGSIEQVKKDISKAKKKSKR